MKPMKHEVKSILAAAVLAVGVSSAQAAPICATATIGVPLGTCVQQDKLWSEFSVNPAWAGATTLDLVSILQANGTFQDEHTVTFGGGFAQQTTYTFSYLIEVDPAAADFAVRFIERVEGGILYSGTPDVGDSTLTKVFVDEDSGNVLATLNLGAALPSAEVDITDTKRIRVTDTFFTDGDNVVSISNNFQQTALRVPEPGTLALLGLGLLGMVASRRKQ